MLTNRSVLRYLWQIRKQIPEWGKKKRILSRVEVSVRDFASSNPRADYDAIVVRFGTPQQIAASCLEDMDTDELLQNFNIKRRIVGIVVATAITAVVLWGGVICFSLIESFDHTGGFIVEEVSVISDIQSENGGNK